MRQKDPNYVHALAKGLDILSAFSEGDMLGNQQLVELTGLPKATVSRMTSTLVQLGYLREDVRSRKLTMGTRVLGMGAGVQRRQGLQHIARPLMQALSRETETTVSLGTRDRLGMLILEVARPPRTTLP
ncbi:MAG: IclR family transcriptional regulator, partial [Burkholderiaceae bacterium]